MSKAKKPHSEVRWVVKYVKDSGETRFGGMLASTEMALPDMRGEGYTATRVRVLVTEIVPKRKAKR